MNEIFYLGFGFALFLTLYRGGRQRETAEILEFSLELVLAFTILISIDLVSSRLLWTPMGQDRLRVIWLFLWGFLLDRIRDKVGRRGRERGEIRLLVSPFLIGLITFCFWTIAKEGALPFRGRFAGGLGAVILAGIVEWFLEGLEKRLRLSRVPRAIEGVPLLIWLAGLLFLAFWGIRGVAFYL